MYYVCMYVCIHIVVKLFDSIVLHRSDTEPIRFYTRNIYDVTNYAVKFAPEKQSPKRNSNIITRSNEFNRSSFLFDCYSESETAQKDEQ